MPDVRRLRPTTSDEGGATNDDGKLGVCAIQVAAILPSYLPDAIAVLEMAKRIATEYLKS